MAYARNPGHIPDDCMFRDEAGEIRFRDVHVRLFNGFCTRRAGLAPWPAGGNRIPTRWEISRRPGSFEIEFYEVA